MKTKKQTGKKVLSVFLAVLMIMTAWVFVAPEQKQASAITVSDVEMTNKTEMDKITEDREINANVVGKFPHDSAGYDVSGAFKNVVYSPKYTNDNRFNGVVNISVTYDKNWAGNRSSAVISYHYSPAVLVYDGVTTPSIGVLMTHDGNKTGGTSTFSSTTNGSWLENTDGLTINEFWRGQCGGNLDFAWAINQGYAADYRAGKYEYYFTTDSKSSSEPSTANKIKYTGSMDDNTYSKTLYPTFHYYGSGSSGGERNATGKGTQPIYVINAKALKKAINEANTAYDSIVADYSKYSTASVAEFVKYAKALYAANPDSYNWADNTKTQVDNYAKEAKAAVDAWNKWSGLVEATYNITWKNYDDSTIITEALKKNATIIAPSDPTKDHEVKTVNGKEMVVHYEFKGWDSTPATKVTGDATYTAQFEPVEVEMAKRQDNYDPSTCTHAGSYNEVKYCSVCKHEFGTTYMPMGTLPHTFTAEVVHNDYLISAATCNKLAKYAKSCVDCGKIADNIELPSNTFEYGDFDYSKHNIVKVDASAASCFAEGIKEHYRCSVCGKLFSDAAGKTQISESDIVAEKLDHTPKVDPGYAPTCYAVGYKDGTICSVCGAIILEQEEIPKLDHEDKDNDHYCDNGCGEEISDHVDNDKDHYCDFENCKEQLSWCEDDINQDHKCDYCGKYDDENFGPHEDADPVDHICDYCGEIDYDKFGRHEDLNKDHKCDNGCEVEFDICEDVDPVDHKCDYGCGKEYGKHEDKDNDHDCDYCCAEKIGTCEDADKDHDCDYGCDKVYGDHEDTNLDHKCDYGCAEEFGVCEDTNLDHKCDYGCDKPYGDHADAENDGNHDCEYCGKKASECTKGEEVKENFVDSTCETEGSYNSVFYCTECGEEVERTNDIKIEKKPHVWSVSYEWAEDGSTCTAIHSCASETPHKETEEVTTKSEVVRDPACGVRGITRYTATFTAEWIEESERTQIKEIDDISPECPDTDMNHWCDDHEPKEGEEGDLNHYKGVHEDKDKDHKCDYGCSEAIGECVDNDKDHYCDHGCGKTFGVCEDKNTDHKCDYGCDKFYGTHADNKNDGNHDCEYCGEKIGECIKGEEVKEKYNDSTCDAEGSYESVFYCTECNKEISRVTVVIEKKDHVWGATVYSWDKDAKTFTATRTCQNFASHVETETVAAVEEILVVPKCVNLETETESSKGLAKYTSAFTVAWATEQTEEVVLEALPHKDDNKDHKCDSGCNEIFGTCGDEDKDHYCDYGCGKYYGVHEDLTGGTDNMPDHKCDYCNVKISDCVDENKDHLCDFNCGASYGTCEDKNKDHHCDYGENCPVFFGVCEDADKDHKCDWGYGCKVTYGEHKWTEHGENDTLKSAATCVSPAIYNNNCAYCGKIVDGGTHEYGEADTENGHRFDGKAVAAETGKHSLKCSVEGCGQIKLVDCTYNTTKEVAATCKSTGYKVEKCIVCKASKRTTLEIDSANHAGGTVIKDGIDATCNTNGYSGDTYCNGCDTKIADGSEITANPAIHAHENMMDYEKVDATCEAEGYEAYRYCDKCDTYAVEKVIIGKKDHKYTEYVSNNNGTHSAKCENCGTTQNDIACTGGTANCVDKKVCEFCNTAYGETDNTKHKKTSKVAKKEATCQVEGYQPYLKCEACDTALEEINTIAKKDHTYGEWTKISGENKHQRLCVTCDPKVAEVASLKEDCSGGFAYCNKLAVCEDCRSEYGTYDVDEHRSTVTTLVGKKEATCYAEGYTGDAYLVCCYDANKSADENASALKEKGTKIDTIAHTYSVEMVGARVPATCTEKGKATYKCATCPEGREARITKDLDVDPNNHSGGTKVVGYVAGSCTEDGFTGNVYYTCCYDENKTEAENIGALKSKGSVIKASGEHKYTEAYPEYMIDELIFEKDENGNIISVDGTIKKEAPSYEEMVASRHEDGSWYHIKVCDECDEIILERCYSYTSDNASCTATEVCEICEGLCSLKNEKNHAEMELIEGHEATCTDDGRKDSYKCTACGKTFLDAAGKNEITAENEYKLVIEANGAHTIDRASKPEAKNNGTHVYKCSICGEAEISENCSGGTATCKTLKKCEYCDASYGELNARNHEEGTIEIGRVDPVKCKPGVKGQVKYTCCNKVVSGGEEIPALEAHSWVEETSKTDNCAQGYTITRTCTVCDTVETEEVAAGSHNLSVVVYETEKSCTTDRSVYYACSICSHTENEVVINGVTYKYIALEQIPAKGECTWTGWTTVKATCVAEGSKSRSCIICGNTENVVLPKVAHTIFVENGYAATCENAGKQDLAFCVIPDCPYAKGGQPIGTVPGYEKYADSKGLVINALGHGDKNGDDYCDNCGRYEGVNSDGTNCNCVCHKQNGFMKLWYKFLQFFWKLFKINKSCCSAGVHY